MIQLAMCGSSGRECNPYELIAPIERQRILLLINSEPLSPEEVARRLGMDVAEVSKHLSELTRCGLVKEVNGLYRPAFAIFTVSDQRVLQPLIEELVSDVVSVVRASIDRVREVAKGLTVSKRGLRIPCLDYVIVGALALDYVGLDTLAEEGLLIKSKPMPGGEYVLAGFEAGLIDLRRSWMWGHNGVFGRYWFSSHGELPPGRGRLAFPDLAMLWLSLGASFERVNAKMIEIGRVLEELLNSDATLKELSDRLGVDEGEIAMDATLLLLTSYVNLVDGKLRLNAPVFTPEDLGAVMSLAKSIAREIASRIRGRRKLIDDLYSRTSPARNGVPMEEAFNQIYHLVFEKALEKLISDGIIEEPPRRIDGGRYAVFVAIMGETR